MSEPLTQISPNDPNIRYIGRVDNSTFSSKVRFDWPGIQISFNFQASGLSVLIQDEKKNLGGQNMFNIFLDGSLYQILNISFSKTEYVIATNLDPNKVHKILITKRTEAFFGITSFNGINLQGTNAKLLPPDPRLSRHLEFVGASVTCGYGNEGTSPCRFTVGTENNYDSYGPMSARALNAEIFVEAWSGKGVVRNGGDPNITSHTPFPAYYPRTLANNENMLWDFSQYLADAVVINLGTNDYSGNPNPPKEVFESGYENFISFFRSHYPKAPVFVVCGPMFGKRNISQLCIYSFILYVQLDQVVNILKKLLKMKFQTMFITLTCAIFLFLVIMDVMDIQMLKVIKK